MDKPILHIQKRVSFRQGFALIVTLSVLSVIIALTSVLVGYLDSAREDSLQSKAMIQGNVYFNDIRQTLKLRKRETFYPEVYKSALMLHGEDGRFSLLLACQPLANGVNINWLGYDNTPQMKSQYAMAENVFESIVQNYNLEDPLKLQEMILEEIGGKGKFVIKADRRLWQKKGIVSLQQFESLLRRYQFEADDLKAGEIPWEKFFVFNEVKRNKNGKIEQGGLIDGAYISAELISVLFNIALETAKEGWKTGEDLKKFLHNNGESFENKKMYAKTFLPMTGCEVTYKYADANYGFSFVDIEGEVKNFEFYAKQ